MSPQRYDAIVIGAGMSGLAAGIRLAQFEKRVVVLEKHALCGGLNSYYKMGGRRLDTGLHALTNFARPSSQGGARGAPLMKLLRQLRISWDELRLSEQSHSEVVFPGARLRFSNDFRLLESQIESVFRSQTDGFARLVRAIDEHDAFGASSVPQGARAILSTYLGQGLLVEMLMEPVLIYGGSTEHDIEWDAFVILFRSIFREGLARPEGGVKRILDLLLKRFRECGGELRMKSGVARILVGRGGSRGVVLEDGTELESEHVFSSAGIAETLGLCGLEAAADEVGRLSFFETITVMSKCHAELGHEATLTFFNTREEFEYRRPQTLIDASSGVICCSDNYATPELSPQHSPAGVRPEHSTEGIQRVTVLANHDGWCALGEDDYRAAKKQACQAIHAAAARHAPDPRAYAILTDAFTPRTIRQYTGHLQGAVYGSPNKRRDGGTGIQNLHVIGTDQGWCGIVGAMLSGITMANRHVLVTH